MKMFKKLQAAAIISISLASISTNTYAGWFALTHEVTKNTQGSSQPVISKAIERYVGLSEQKPGDYIVFGEDRYKNGAKPMTGIKLLEYRGLIGQVEVDYQQYQNARTALTNKRTSILRGGGDLESEESVRTLRYANLEAKRLAINFEKSLAALSEATKTYVKEADMKIHTSDVNFLGVCSTVDTNNYNAVVSHQELMAQSQLCNDSKINKVIRKLRYAN